MSTPAKEKAPPSCEHCHKQLPFGKFRLTKRVTGAEKNSVYSMQHSCHIMHKDLFLCADCGFNLVNLRVARNVELVERVENPWRDKPTWRTREMFVQNRPYLACTLLTRIEVVYEAALEADRLRYYEQRKAIDELNAMKRRTRIANQMRRQGASEEEIAEMLAGKAVMPTSGSSLRVVVPGTVSPRKGGTVAAQRESSPSPLIGATISPRRSA